MLDKVSDLFESDLTIQSFGLTHFLIHKARLENEEWDVKNLRKAKSSVAFQRRKGQVH